MKSLSFLGHMDLHFIERQPIFEIMIVYVLMVTDFVRIDFI